MILLLSVRFYIKNNLGIQLLPIKKPPWILLGEYLAVESKGIFIAAKKLH